MNFDQRFYYYVDYVDTADDLPDTSTKETEEAKSSIWETEGLEFELSMALDPESFAAKVLNLRKGSPTPKQRVTVLLIQLRNASPMDLLKPQGALHQQVHQHHRNRPSALSLRRLASVTDVSWLRNENSLKRTNCFK